MKYYLAIDIGASSGRHILGHLENGKLILEEIYRFENGPTEVRGALTWDIDYLVSVVKKGIQKCKEIGKIPTTIAIDTWAVDYVLLNDKKEELKPAFCYRDSRTIDVPSLVEGKIPSKRLYEITGIQKQSFNTIYQLYEDKNSGKLDQAEYFLMMPEYLSYKLTGVMKNEYTNASTTSLLSAQDKKWDTEILDILELPKKLLGKLSVPGEVIGNFSKEVENEMGFRSTVICAPSHDTASAVAACPMENQHAYISSGTWSLIGTELINPNTSEMARQANFTNEGGVDYRFRFLKNYMGMWLFQNIKKNLNGAMSYDEMMELAQSCPEFKYFDVNEPSLVAPKNMIEAIKTLIGIDEDNIGLILNSVYHSLARSYKDAILEIEKITKQQIKAIHIVGGGSKDSYLNKLTSKYTERPVTAGPVEATAIGNIITQIMFDQKMSLQQARDLVKNSFNIKEV